MEQDKIVIKTQKYIRANANAVWSYLCDVRRFPALFSNTAAAEFTVSQGEAEGTMRLGRLVFRLRMAPYDLSMRSEPCSIVLRVTPYKTGCTVAMASSCDPNSGFSVRESDLVNVLARLDAAVGSGGGAGSAEALNPEAPRKSRPVKEPRPETLPGAEEQERRKPGRKLVLGVIAVLAVAALVFGGVRLFGRHEVPEAVGAGDLSASVTYANAVTLSLGQSRAEIETALGTTGVARGSGEILYRCDTLGKYGTPNELVLVVYEGGKASAITYLNTAASSNYEAAAGRGVAVSTVASPDELSAQAGLPVSMLRRYVSGADELLEVHFGFCDPFANFDPAWRGEIAVTENLTQGTASVGYWGGYDGADPLMVSSLEGTPLEYQYDSYTEFLQDKYQYDRALNMLGRWSMGDMRRWYPELEAYESGSGAAAYRASYTSPASGDGSQRYAISYLLDNANGFLMGSFANLALYERAGTLDHTRAASISRNMSYGEVRTLMGIVPTALFVNENFYYVCYGNYLGGAEIEEQFALVVKFDIDTNMSDRIYDNVPRSGAPQQGAEEQN